MSHPLDPLQPGFMLLQGNRLEDLRDLLTQWISHYPLNPLEDETILVQSNGIAQWLKMALARDEGGCGIAAAMKVDLPGRFLWQAYRSVFDELPEISPYDKAPLTWRLYRLLGDWPGLVARLQELGENPEHLEPLEGFLKQDNDPRRLHQLAANLADLYDQYQVYRADWLEAWETNQEELADSDRWQAVVWRLLIDDVKKDSNLDAAHTWARASRASIHQAVIQKCKDYTPDQRPEDLPRRVLVFGISSLPRQTLDLLHALAPFTQILVFANNPCQHYWGDLVEGKELLRREYKRIAERKIASDLSPEDLHLEGHPLLASWGKQGRDYLHLLDEQDNPDSYRERLAELQQSIDVYRDPLDEGDCLLTQLQSDIFDLRPLKDRQDKNTEINPDQDQSLQFLVAHSPQREVEILHDQLLATFEEAEKTGKKLPPREVLVMVPDINVYAPHIQAVFGRYAGKGDDRDARFLPFHIADQGQRGQNTLLIALENLLHLPRSRFTVSELLDLLDTPALRQRYGIKEADLPRLREWIQGANIRWGLNAQQRADLGLPAQEQNTWLFGLRRLLLGFASGSSEAWQGIEPHDEVAGLEAALLGPLAQLLKDLESTRDELQKDKTPKEWSETLKALMERFFVDTSKADAWALTNLDIQLEKLEKVWQQGSLVEQTLPLEVIREELLSALDQPTLTQKFLGGAINFATLMPMRAIPFQQVWLLGMNDGDYPRSVRPADFDLMAKDYRPGDRSRREDDRYLFLEALLSARQKLVISWVGRNIRDNTPRPPSVLVGQLRDHLAAGWKGEELLKALTTEHPLQAFSSKYFIEPETDSTTDQNNQRFVTFAYEWKSLFEPTKCEPAGSDPLPPWLPENNLAIKHLNDFLRCPADAFYKERLKVYPAKELDTLDEVESFAFNGLEAWELKDRLIQQTFLPDATNESYPALLEEALKKLVRQGSLIEGALGEHQSIKLTETLPDLFSKWQESRAGLQPLERPLTDLLQIPLEGSNTLTMDLSSPYLLSGKDQGSYTQLIVQTSDATKKVTQASTTYSWRNLTRPWLQHLVAQVLLKQPITTKLLTPKGEITWNGLEAEKAQELISQLARIWWQGMQSPLPTALNTGIQWLLSLKKEAENRDLAAINAAKGFKTDASYSNHLIDVYPDFEQLYEQSNFISLTEKLYTPIFQAVKTENNS